MHDLEIPEEYYGWWRITTTSAWGEDALDLLGPAMISFTGGDDRLRMLALLADVDCRPTRTGVSFKWNGVWEFDEMSGSDSVRLRKDGTLSGKIRFKDGDESSFVAERAEPPTEPIPDPPPRKWRKRW